MLTTTHDGYALDENGVFSVFQPAASQNVGRDIQFVGFNAFLEVIVDVG